MRIVNVILEILQEMVNDTDCALQSYQYNDRPTANVHMDNGKHSPTALLYQVTDFNIGMNAINEKETANIMVSFLQKESKLDAQGIEQQNIIDRMKYLAVQFIQRLSNTNLRVKGDTITAKSVYLRTDSNRTGVMLTLDLEERQGQCIDSQPNNLEISITENGKYDVFGYNVAYVDVKGEVHEPYFRIFGSAKDGFSEQVVIYGAVPYVNDDCESWGYTIYHNRYGQKVTDVEGYGIKFNPIVIKENMYPVSIYTALSETEQPYHLVYGKSYHIVPFIVFNDGTRKDFEDYSFTAPLKS